MTELERTLLVAAANGEIIRVIYAGGSQPGSVREILPISVRDGQLEADDITSQAVKSYKLDKLMIATPDTIAPVYLPNFVPPPNESDQSVEETFAGVISELRSMGWHVELHRDSIELFTKFKNGKVRKTAVAGLRYSEFVTDMVYDLDAEDFVDESRPSQRPYAVFGPNLTTTRTFAKLVAAKDLFLSLASECAPHAD